MKKFYIWISQLLIGIVFFFNIQCAVVFILQPLVYAPGFEVDGEPGKMLVQGMGILFLMWNVPYAFALVNPLRYNTSLLQAIIMQAVGFLGESLLLLSLPTEHALLRSTAIRFILFDGGGLILLLISLWFTRKFPKTQK